MFLSLFLWKLNCCSSHHSNLAQNPTIMPQICWESACCCQGPSADEWTEENIRNDEEKVPPECMQELCRYKKKKPSHRFPNDQPNGSKKIRPFVTVRNQTCVNRAWGASRKREGGRRSTPHREYKSCAHPPLQFRNKWSYQSIPRFQGERARGFQAARNTARLQADCFRKDTYSKVVQLIQHAYVYISRSRVYHFICV